jgi:hypothetical protein
MPKAQNRGWKDDKAGTIVLAKKKAKRSILQFTLLFFFLQSKPLHVSGYQNHSVRVARGFFWLAQYVTHVRQRKLLPFFSEVKSVFFFCSQEKLSAWIGEKRRKQEFLERGCKQLTFEYLYAAHLNACEACRVVSLDCMWVLSYRVTFAKKEQKSKGDSPGVVVVEEK